ncbi:hypothetical protein CXT84_03670 [Akkermansia muciniphila]|nr:hypothetical protein CXT84_03670 [Akkermansia muciniphila]
MLPIPEAFIAKAVQGIRTEKRAAAFDAPPVFLLVKKALLFVQVPGRDDASSPRGTARKKGTRSFTCGFKIPGR